MTETSSQVRWTRYIIVAVVFGALLVSIILGTEIMDGNLLSRNSDQESEEPEFEELPPRERADLAFENSMWRQARDSYQDMIDEDQFNHRAWFRLGYSHHKLDELDAAANAYQRANEFPDIRIYSQYNLACIYALQGRLDDAIASLRESIEGGFTTTDGIDSDTDFDSLVDDPEFQRLVMIERRRIDRRLRRR